MSITDRISDTFMRRESGDWNYSLIPFKTIFSTINTNYSSGFSLAIKLFIGNILVFIPLGYFIPKIYKSNLIFSILYCIIIIFFIELIQFLTGLGIGDIDDVILNTLGCLIGYLVYLGLESFRSATQIKKTEPC